MCVFKPSLQGVNVWKQNFSENRKKIGPGEIWTRVAGFKVLSANHYTTGEYLLPILKMKYLSRHIISNFSNPKSDV